MSLTEHHQQLKALVFCDYYLPGFRGGGPITTLRNMVLNLNGAVKFHIITRAHDLGEHDPYPDIRPGHWENREGAIIMYTETIHMTVGRILSEILHQKPDVIYLNSVLSRRYSLIPLLAAIRARKSLDPSPLIILAPRGEFSAGALSLKPWQKNVYLGTLRRLGLWRNVVWQASTVHEAADIRRQAGPGAKVCVAPDLPSPLIIPADLKVKRTGGAVIAFVGRISPMKNLHTAIRIIAKLKGHIEFVIVGPAEDKAYWAQCQKEIECLPEHIKVTIKGSLPPSEVLGTLTQSDILLLPSLGENFAHVVLEALGAGCPVALSDRTPWRDLQPLGVGADIALEAEEQFVTFLQGLVDMDEQSFHQRKRAAQDYARQFVANNVLAENYISMFQGKLQT